MASNIIPANEDASQQQVVTPRITHFQYPASKKVGASTHRGAVAGYDRRRSFHSGKQNLVKTGQRQSGVVHHHYNEDEVGEPSIESVQLLLEASPPAEPRPPDAHRNNQRGNH